jgi:UDP-3-O-[3-hydroxymyristoyl] glucosamine N-acyltransferase
MFEVRAGELSRQLGGELVGDADLVLRRIAPLETADADCISFLASARHRAQLQDTSAGCVIVAPAFAEQARARPAAIVCGDPYLYYARLTQWWVRQMRSGNIEPGIHRSAVIEPGAKVHARASVGALAHVGRGAVVAAHASIGSQSHVGDGALVGEGTRLSAHVTLGAACRIGARGIVHSGAVIGADGFGFAPVEGRWEKIEQLGAVRIDDDVEIGANTCIDRGALQDTVIEQGVKLDNLIQIAHNVHVGRHTAMAACVGIAGSTRIGAHCTLAGQVGIAGHLQIVDHVHIAAAAVITRSILKPGSYGGVFPFDDNLTWEKNAATLRQLHTLRTRLRALEKNSS